jgi:hypothetical protein
MLNMTRFSLAAALALLVGCGLTDPTERSFNIQLETSHTMAQGDIVEIPVTIQRTNFDGPITFSVQQLPPGMSLRFSPPVMSRGATQTTLVVETTGAASPGATAITILARGDGVPTRTITLDVAIHLRGSYTLELIDTKVTAAQGGWGSASVALRRLNANASEVAISVSGLPAGVTTSPSLTSDGPGTSIAFTASASATVGTHAVTITSSAAGTPSQSATLSLAIIPPPATSDVTIPFCQFMPIWFAYQNEGYEWRRVTPSGNNFSFAATERVAIAFTFALTNNGSELQVRYATRQELSLLGIDCQASKTITGSVSGLGSGQRAYVEFDDVRTQATSSSPGFTLTGVREGNYDLVASRGNLPNAIGFRPDRFIVRRGLNPPDGSVLPTLDFGAEGFDPVQSALTVSGLSADEDLDWAVYLIGANVSWTMLHDGFGDPTPTTTHAFPTAALQPGELQALVVEGTTYEAQGFHMHERVQYEFFDSPVDHSVSLPPVLPTPQIELFAVAPYQRLRVQIASQPAYDAVAEILMWNTEFTRDILLTVTAAYLGGRPTTWDLVVPDFGNLSALGVNAAWMFPSVSEYWAFVYSSPAAIYWGARPNPGDVWRYASDLAYIGSNPCDLVACPAPSLRAISARGRGVRLQPNDRLRLRR